jgi:hypothetical protein
MFRGMTVHVGDATPPSAAERLALLLRAVQEFVTSAGTLGIAGKSLQCLDSYVLFSCLPPCLPHWDVTQNSATVGNRISVLPGTCPTGHCQGKYHAGND